VLAFVINISLNKKKLLRKKFAKKKFYFSEKEWDEKN